MGRTIQTKFMAKLAAEKEATLRLKGENGIMKKKFSRLSKSVTCRCNATAVVSFQSIRCQVQVDVFVNPTCKESLAFYNLAPIYAVAVPVL